MSWQAKLAERRERFSGWPDTPPPELTKPPFVGFGSRSNGHAENINLRSELLKLADLEGIAPALVHALTPADLIECTGLPDRVLLTYLHAVEETADRMAGRVPADETAAILCRSCGPVWAHPAIAEALPKVDGWPRALGCPWCHVRAVGKRVPRPPITCTDCKHYQRDKINPAGGFGSCAAGHGSHYPNEPHRCGDLTPRGRGGSNV